MAGAVVEHLHARPEDGAQVLFGKLMQFAGADGALQAGQEVAGGLGGREAAAQPEPVHPARKLALPPRSQEHDGPHRECPNQGADPAAQVHGPDERSDEREVEREQQQRREDEGGLLHQNVEEGEALRVVCNDENEGQRADVDADGYGEGDGPALPPRLECGEADPRQKQQY